MSTEITTLAKLCLESGSGYKYRLFFYAFHDLNASKMQETDVLEYVVFKVKGNEELYLLCVQF